jgi:FemAB family
MKILAEGYSVEVDCIRRESWIELMGNFDDYNIFQAWSYGAVRHGEERISHLILKRGSSVVAAAQARIVKLPFLGIGIAYVRWGPLWKVSGRQPDPEIFRQTVRALRNEYTCRRGLALRVFPLLFEDDDPSFLSHLQNEGFSLNASLVHERTLIVDLRPPLEELRKGLNQKWRNHLNKAEKNQLNLMEGSDNKMFEMFIDVYKEMVARKNFVDLVDVQEFKAIQNYLIEEQKMRVFLSLDNGRVGAGAVCTTIGKTGIYLLGATNDIGIKDNGSYLVQWRILEFLKSKGCIYYNLHGINPAGNPGTYNFKKGLCGTNGRDVTFLGRFDTYPNSITRLSVKSGDKLRILYQRAKRLVH